MEKGRGGQAAGREAGEWQPNLGCSQPSHSHLKEIEPSVHLYCLLGCPSPLHLSSWPGHAQASSYIFCCHAFGGSLFVQQMAILTHILATDKFLEKNNNLSRLKVLSFAGRRASPGHHAVVLCFILLSALSLRGPGAVKDLTTPMLKSDMGPSPDANLSIVCDQW